MTLMEFLARTSENDRAIINKIARIVYSKVNSTIELVLYVLFGLIFKKREISFSI